MKHSEQIDKIASALISVQKEIGPVARDAVNPHFKSHYATLDSITEYVRPILAEKGLAVIQGGGDMTNGGLMIETTLLHTSGQWISQSFEIPVEKNSPQAAGSTITYGRRYGLAAFLALTTEEDDDANAGTNRAGGTHSAMPQGVTRTAPSSAEPPASRSNGSTNGTGGFLMPFGKTKGTPIGTMSTKDLEGALAWASEKEKFLEFQDAARKELDRRLAPRAAEEMPAALDDQPDDLPF